MTGGLYLRLIWRHICSREFSQFSQYIKKGPSKERDSPESKGSFYSFYRYIKKGGAG